MKAITESEFKNASKIVDAYFDQVNKKNLKVRLTEIINRDLTVNKEIRLTDLSFINICFVN